MNVNEPDLFDRSVGFFLNVLAMLSVMLRLWRREQQMSTSSGKPNIYTYLSDIFIIIAYVLAIGNSIVAWPQVRRSSDGVKFLDSDIEHLLWSKYLSDMLASSLQRQTKPSSLTRNPQYTLSNGATKASITTFVLGHLDKLDPKRSDLVKLSRKVVYWTIASTMLFALQCHPLQKAWKTDVEGMCISPTLIHIIQTNLSMHLDGCMFGIMYMSRLIRTKPLGMAIILFTDLIIAASNIYSNIIATPWMSGLVRVTSYEGLKWPAMDLFMRVVFANTPFLYSAYMGEPAMKNSV